MLYLDNAATTAVRPEVLEAMMPYLEPTALYGNPSSYHEFGRKAKKGIETARVQVANSIGAKPQEIIFTSSGSESDNLAIKGWCDYIFLNSQKRQNITLVSSEIEHKAILNSCRYMFETRRDVDYSKVYVDHYGFVKKTDLKNVLEYAHKYGHKILVSIMFANNEIGTIQEIKNLAEICHEYSAVFHTDATQYYGHGKIDVEELSVDMLTASGHKVGAPKGIAFLYVKEGIELSPLIHGGKQERGLRAGTENVAGIVGLGCAASMIDNRIQEEGIIRKKTMHFYNSLLNYQMKQSSMCKVSSSKIKINGFAPHEKILGSYRRLGNNLSLLLKGVDTQSLLEMLSEKGIYASAGSACNEGNSTPSHVLKAIGLSSEDANNTIRFSFSSDMKDKELEEAAEYLSVCINMLRKTDKTSKYL